MSPQLAAETLAAQITSYDEETHEAKTSGVGKDRAAAGEFRALAQGDKRLRVGLPRNVEISLPGIPAFIGRPSGENRDLLAMHRSNRQISRRHQSTDGAVSAPISARWL